MVRVRNDERFFARASKGAGGRGDKGERRLPVQRGGGGLIGGNVAVFIQQDHSPLRRENLLHRRVQVDRFFPDENGSVICVKEMIGGQQRALRRGVIGPVVPRPGQGGHAVCNGLHGVSAGDGGLRVGREEGGFGQLQGPLLLGQGLVGGLQLAVGCFQVPVDSFQRIVHGLQFAVGRFQFPVHGGDLHVGGFQLLVLRFDGAVAAQQDRHVAHQHGQGHARRSEGPLLLPLLLPPDQGIVGAAQDGREQAHGFPGQQLQGLGLRVGADVCRQGLHNGIVFISQVGQLAGKGAVRIAGGQHGQHVGPIVALQEVFDLPLHPDGFRRVGRANDDEKFGMVQGAANIGGQIAGNGQLILVPKGDAKPFAPALPQGPRHAVALDQRVGPLGHRHIVGLVAVADEGDVFSFGSRGGVFLASHGAYPPVGRARGR